MTIVKRTSILSTQQAGLGVALLLCATLAHAEGAIIPHARISYEHDSDLLLAPDKPSSLPIDGSGQPRLEDSFEDYSFGIDGEDRWRDNRLYLTTNFSRFEYQNFTQLNHDEFAGTTGLDWTATHKIKGNIGGEYSRHLLSFIDATAIDNATPTNSYVSYLETTEAAKASATYDMNSHWSTEAGGSYSTAKLPDAGAISYDLNQSEGNVGVKYIGSARLTTGISIDRASGNYKESSQPGYTQTVYQYTIDYKIGARTSVSGGIGYTIRAQSDPQINLDLDNSATTGSFTFSQQLTAKTSYYLQFQRLVNTYNAALGSQLTTGGSAGLTWQATPKISLSGTYERDQAQVTGAFSGVGTASSDSHRNDNIDIANVNIKYNALRWLTISPYYRYQKRVSQVDNFDFNNSAYGINFEARFQP